MYVVFTLGIIFIIGKECQKIAVTAISLFLCFVLFWKFTQVQIMFAAAEEQFAHAV
jgi:hypothetical protein